MRTRVIAIALWGVCSMAQAGALGPGLEPAACDVSGGSVVSCSDEALIVPVGGAEANAQVDAAYPVAAVPEPAAFLMLAVGLICMGGIARQTRPEPFK